MRPALAALIALAGGTGSVASAATQALTYRCERGVEIPAVYVNAEGQPGVVVLWIEGRLINLEAIDNAMGVRYAFPSDKSGYVWWTHDGTAQLSWMDVPKGEEVFLYAACQPEG